MIAQATGAQDKPPLVPRLDLHGTCNGATKLECTIPAVKQQPHTYRKHTELARTSLLQHALQNDSVVVDNRHDQMRSTDEIDC